MRGAIVGLAIVVALVPLAGLAVWLVVTPPAPLSLPGRGLVLSPG